MSTFAQSMKVEVLRRKGTRHMRLRLGHANQLIASVPWHCSEAEVRRFVDAQQVWIEAQLAKVPPPKRLVDWLTEHPRLSGSGDIYAVRIERHSHGRVGYSFDRGGSEIILQIPDSSEPADTTLTQLVQRFAKDALTCRVAYHAKRLGLAFTKLSVRDQSSRWGSCSSSGGISLNWRLVIVDPHLQDYVILHELAHLTEMNHSRRFWSLLDSYDANRRAHEEELDALTPAIMRVGRPTQG